MAEKVEIDIPGIGLIEAKNAATEATLLEILRVLEGTQKDNNKNAKGQKTDANKGSQSPAGGGGGGQNNIPGGGTASAGGSGGGGNGGLRGVTEPTSGLINSGSGGGGHGGEIRGSIGGSGGSGIVIIRYPV